ncbi:MAG: histidinol-phosphate transaminase [Verrucomicrobiae bacterium]|nr:histidinol-phosphate transaminase [Verrucomicrobiae bacterium]
MISPCPHLARLPVYEPGRPIEEVARELGLDPARIVKLASNENPLGPSPKAVAAMRKAAARAHLYPDGNGFLLRRTIAAKHRLPMEQVVLANGSNEIIEFLGHAFLSPGDDIVVSRYAFAIYAIVAHLFRARVNEAPARAYGHNLEAMRAAITPRTRLVFVANPNNPTGTAVPPAALARFLRAMPAHALAVVDEAYQEFLDRPLDTPRLLAEKPNLVVMRTFSKAHGLAGLRIGYGLASPAVAAALQKVRQPFNANLVAQNAARAALGDAAHLRATIRAVAEGRALLHAAFRARKLEFVPSHANFILVRVGDGRKIFEALLRRGVIVRPMDGYRLPEWIRVTVGARAENRAFLKSLDAALADAA